MPSTSIRHIQSLDGIRAVAAMTVFASHAFPMVTIPSSVGVTVFFFLSGFLITTLLRREFQASGRISLRNFYIRRACRIFPPMYFMLVAMLLFAMVTRGAHEVDGMSVLAQAAHLTNYLIVLSRSDATVLPFTSVMWSLAVEEHFYLVFPLLFIMLIRRMLMHKVARVLGVICVLVLVWRIFIVQQPGVIDTHIFYATDARFDSLLFGCIMGVWHNPVLDVPPTAQTRLSFGCKVVLAAAVGVLLFSMGYRNVYFQQTLRYTIQGIALFPLFWLAVRYPSGLAFRWLNWAPVRWFGGVSYSFYLAHPFWLHVTNEVASGWRAAALGFALTTVFSAALYWQLERPFQELGQSLSGERRPTGLTEQT